MSVGHHVSVGADVSVGTMCQLLANILNDTDSFNSATLQVAVWTKLLAVQLGQSMH